MVLGLVAEPGPTRDQFLNRRMPGPPPRGDEEKHIPVQGGKLIQVTRALAPARIHTPDFPPILSWGEGADSSSPPKSVVFLLISPWGDDPAIFH